MTSIDMTWRGALLVYAPDFAAMLQRNAWVIDRIQKGTKPADCPSSCRRVTGCGST